MSNLVEMVGLACGRVLVMLTVVYNSSPPGGLGTVDELRKDQCVGAQRREVCELRLERLADRRAGTTSCVILD